MSERQKIVSPDIKDNFVMIPKLIDDSDLDTYEYRLLIHYYRVGNCWKNTSTTAHDCKMSRPQVIAKRKSLEEKGWIKITRGGTQDTLLIEVVDKWDENHKKYMGDKKKEPPHMAIEQQASQDVDQQEVTELTTAGQDVDSIKIKIKNNPVLKDVGAKEMRPNNAARKIAEDKFKAFTSLAIPTRKSEAAELWWYPLREICIAADWDHARIEQIIEESVMRLRDSKLTISSPKSILKTSRAIAAESKNGAGRVKYNADEMRRKAQEEIAKAK